MIQAVTQGPAARHRHVGSLESRVSTVDMSTSLLQLKIGLIVFVSHCATAVTVVIVDVCHLLSLRLLMRATNPCALMWFPLTCCSNLSISHVFNKFLKDVPPRGHELAFSLAFAACPRAFDPLPGEFPLDIDPHSSGQQPAQCHLEEP